MTTLAKVTKAVAVSAFALVIATSTGCGIVDTSTYTAKVISHKQSGKNCRAEIVTEKGEAKSVSLGNRGDCNNITDGQTVKFSGGIYQR